MTVEAFEKGSPIINYHRTKLPNELDRKKIFGFVGRSNDQKNVIRSIIEIKNSGKVLNIKGSGGIGKTTLICKVVHEFSLRGVFKQGINFVPCEFISSYKIFEAHIAKCFGLDNAIDLKIHLRDTFSQLDALIILDNFETLLTLENHKETEDVKELVKYISDYSSIVITSREKIGYSFEEVYPLGNLTTDEAFELFMRKYKINLSNKKDEKILRSEILEGFLNNNPLAIKLISNNSPNFKNILSLRDDLKNNFNYLFDIDDVNIDQVFDRKADINIERTKSLFQSINYSYTKLNTKQKLAFDLLHLFPDGISHKNFRECFSKKNKHGEKINQTHTEINDRDIKALEDKSLVENNSGTIKLQSIIGRFANYQFNQRSENEKQNYYIDAYSYNVFMLEILEKFDSLNEQIIPYSIFDQNANNFIFALKYIDKIKTTKKRYLLNYTNSIAHYILSEGSIIQYIENINSITSFFSDLDYAVDSLTTKRISFLFHHRFFDRPYNELQEKYPINQILQETVEDKKKDQLKLHYLVRALSIHNYEGKTLEYLKWLSKVDFYKVGNISSAIFYLGTFNYNEDGSSFYKFERDLVLNRLNTETLKLYIDSLFEKNHLERLQCTYTLSKKEYVTIESVKKLVVTNPYSRGLKFLMFAFIEPKIDKRIKLFEEAISNLEHIKYYYIEAIYFFSKYLKEINNIEFEKWHKIGNNLSNKFNYRYQIHRFKNLTLKEEVTYKESDYPINDVDNFSISNFVENYNKEWPVKNSNQNLSYNGDIISTTYKKKFPKILFVEGKTDMRIFNKAISLFSNKLTDVKIETDISDFGAGVNWVRKSILSFATNPDKNKGKAIAILDNDKAGADTYSQIIKNPDYIKDSQKKKVKSLLIGKNDKPKHIIEFYEKGVLHRNSDYGITIETFFPIKYWEYAKDNGWLEEIDDISSYSLKNKPTEPAERFVLDKGISERKLLYIFSKIKSEYKEKFANYICNLEEKESIQAFVEFKKIIKKIELFFIDSTT